MKKTVSVNIKGTNFLIEEDAYELLQDYLDRLKIALKHEAGSKEIIEDIELRIAEQCSALLNDSKTVIELEEIEHILEALGNPEDYVDEDESAFSEEAQEAIREERKQSGHQHEKRFFRDIDDAMLGGVCSGLASYFGMDVAIVRLIFVVFIFIGFGVPLYIILWLVIPSAESTIDRLRMKGRPITVETVKEEVENAAERIKEESRSFAQRFRNDDRYKKRMSRSRRILLSILGVFFLGIGIVQLITFLFFIIFGFEVIPVGGEGGFISLTEFGELTMNDSYSVKWAWISGLMAALSSITFLLLLGSLLIFQVKYKWTKYALGSLFLTGLTGVVVFGALMISTAKDIANEDGVEKTIGTCYTDELVIIPRSTGVKSNSVFREIESEEIGFFGFEGNDIAKYNVQIEYVPSRDSLFRIRQKLTARSTTTVNAREKGRNIKHGIILKGDSLFVDTKYLFPKKDKLRDQEVTIVIEIPNQKTVRLRDKIIHLGSKNKDEDLDHPYYKEEGVLRSDGSYRHYIDD